MVSRLRSIGEAAHAMGVSKDSVRRLIRAGALRSVRIGKRVMIPESELERACLRGLGPHAMAVVPRV
jgi:excisionase family DNA binding protein